MIPALQAARILNMLDFDDERFEEALLICLAAQPNLPSACNLMEVFLFEHDRLEDLEAHFYLRATSAPSDAAASDILVGGASLLLRSGAGAEGTRVFAEAIARASKVRILLAWGAGTIAGRRCQWFRRAIARHDICRIATRVTRFDR